MAATLTSELRNTKHMHPDQAGYIEELYAYYRAILVRNLTPEQLQLHDYYSTTDSLYAGEDCFDEFPLVDGLPEMLLNALDDDLEDDYEEDPDDDSGYFAEEGLA